MDIYAQIAEKIIRAQEAIIGPIAVEQAKRVPNMEVNWDRSEVSIQGDGSTAINNLVAVYQELFGQMSQQVCKDAVAPLLHKLPANSLPEALK